jgi:hypothetical protein
VEEFLYDVVIELFLFGMQASKHRLYGKSMQEIEKMYEKDIFQKTVLLFGKHRIHTYLRELDEYSVQIIAEDLAVRWFKKGVHYGEKQRKLRLL